MSLVYITHHDENILDIEKNLNRQTLIKRSYESKFKKTVRASAKKPGVIDQPDGIKLITDSKKWQRRTMGYAETPIEPPCNYLKKHHGVRWRRQNDHTCFHKEIPPVPRLGKPPTPKIEKPPEPIKPIRERKVEKCTRLILKNQKHRANFVKLNIERMKTSEPRRPPPKYVDTPQGDRHLLLQSGLIPRYICRKGYGKVPCYLEIHRKMLEDIKQRCQSEALHQKDMRCMPFVSQGIRQLTTDERLEILAGLKTNFDSFSKIYNSLSLYTDTMAKKLRKGSLEKTLRQLEQDINLIENNPIIFVSDF